MRAYQVHAYLEAGLEPRNNDNLTVEWVGTAKQHALAQQIIDAFEMWTQPQHCKA